MHSNFQWGYPQQCFHASDGFFSFRSTDYGSTYERMNDKVGSKTVLSYLYVCPSNKRKVRRSFITKVAHQWKCFDMFSFNELMNVWLHLHRPNSISTTWAMSYSSVCSPESRLFRENSFYSLNNSSNVYFARFILVSALSVELKTNFSKNIVIGTITLFLALVFVFKAHFLGKANKNRALRLTKMIYLEQIWNSDFFITTTQNSE